MANALVVRSQSASPIYTVTPAASVTLDFNNGSIQTITLDDDTAFQAPSNLENGATYLLKVVQDATGSVFLEYPHGMQCFSGKVELHRH